MNPRNALIAGAVLAIGFTAASLLTGPNEADAQTRPVIIDLSEAVVTGASVQFPADGGCVLQPRFNQTGREQHVPAGQDYNFNGARCQAFRNAVAKAVAAELGFTDGGTP